MSSLGWLAFVVAIFIGHENGSVAAPRGEGLGGLVPPNPKSRQKLSKKNAINLVGYTLRLKNYVKIPPFLSDFSKGNQETAHARYAG